MGPEEQEAEGVEFASEGEAGHHGGVDARHDGDPRLVEGIKCVQEGCYTEAIPLLKAVLRDDETSRDAWYGLGYCYYKHGNLLQSRLLFERALDLGNRAAAEMLARIEYRLAKGHRDQQARIPPSIVSLDGSEEYRTPEHQPEDAEKQDEPAPEPGDESSEAAREPDSEPEPAAEEHKPPQVPEDDSTEVAPEAGSEAVVADEEDTTDEPAQESHEVSPEEVHEADPEEDPPTDQSATPPDPEDEPEPTGQLEFASDESEEPHTPASPQADENPETSEEQATPVEDAATPASSPNGEGAEVPEWEAPSDSDALETGEEADGERAADAPPEQGDASEDEEPEDTTGSLLDQLTAQILDEEGPVEDAAPAEAPKAPALSDETPYPDLFSRLVSEPDMGEGDDSEALLIGAYDFTGTAIGLWGVAWAAVLVTLLTAGLGLPFGVVWLLRYCVTRSVVADGRLEFRGTGAGLFGWYLLFALPLAGLAAMAFVVPQDYRIPWYPLAAYAVLALLVVPYLFARWSYAHMYWCKRRFIFEADYAEWFGVYVIYLLLCPLASLGLLLPWGVKRYILWEGKTLEVAGRSLSFHGRATQLMGWMLLNLALLVVHLATLGFSAAWIALRVAKWFVKSRRFVDRDPGLGSLATDD